MTHGNSIVHAPPPMYRSLPPRASASDHARTAATAILDALLPTKRRHRRHSHSVLNSIVHQTLIPRLSHVENDPAALLQHPFYVSQNHTLQTPHQTLPPDLTFDTSPTSVCLTRLGHSTMLINLFGTIILTDPVLSDRVGIELFGKTIGIDRYTAPILDISNIPQPDIILLSHAHFDHTDLPTLRRFTATYPDSITVVCAKNTQDVIDDLAWKRVHELDWDEELLLGSTKIRGLEVIHNGWRCPWERDRASGYTTSGRSYNAYFIEHNGVKLVFGGDTAFTTTFERLRGEGVNVAMMPIGAYQGYESLHCTPEQALQMAIAMNAEYIVPIHFGVFYQSNEAPHEPLERLLTATSAASPIPVLTDTGEMMRLLRR